jgi:hypothetical protein
MTVCLHCLPGQGSAISQQVQGGKKWGSQGLDCMVRL